MRFEAQFFEYLQQLLRINNARPVMLGGYSASGGGAGGAPGGFIGYLPQTRVAYDLTEGAMLGFVEPGAINASGEVVSGSLLDNLNHIRYRIEQIEGGGGVNIWEDGTLVASGITILDFLTDHIVDMGGGRVTISGAESVTFLDLTDTPDTYTNQGNKIVTVKGDETGLEFITVSSGGGGDTFKVKISSDDTTEDFLENKLVAGTNISILTLNDGANEDLEISISGLEYSELENRPYRVITFGLPGTLEVKTLEPRLHAPFAGTIANVTAAVNTAPQGDDIIIDVFKNGSTIFTTSGNRPTILDTELDDLSSIPDIVSVSLNDVFKVGIIQVGTTVSGEDLVVQIRCEV